MIPPYFENNNDRQLDAVVKTSVPNEVNKITTSLRDRQPPISNRKPWNKFDHAKRFQAG